MVVRLVEFRRIVTNKRHPELALLEYVATSSDVTRLRMTQFVTSLYPRLALALLACESVSFLGSHRGDS